MKKAAKTKPAELEIPEGVEKPFLKWAGRKTKLVPAIKRHLPKKANRFIEPFVGSGAVFVNTDYAENILADSNQDIITLFQFLKDEKKDFIDLCKSYFMPENNMPDMFNALRAKFNKTKDAELRAALFIYLNRHCFNGLCRYNSEGKFNVPFGLYSKPYFPAQEMRAFAKKLQKATLLCKDFREIMAMAGEGDVVYCDPPYIPLSATSNFTGYAAGGFSLKDQKDLAKACEKAAKRGAVVVLSNHDTPLAREIFKNAGKTVSVDVSRTISAKGASRGKVKELIAIYKGDA